ncbi:Gfo/Idh/MocA family oxidoreductase [Singulisphaera acidiphila]|uniref:Putative dehydrogenase n=1 Tax=Singulisphaera acidiphila (strain ATCC BAA-1392 / DSM 18658 / VKM B-2454 / MOB10) TaxID=886293 RepID=L0DLJ4_SINAD|nr:Gfo/Idh/MocA family oxidoreductase [Singulisphaera acidiphila]AGA30259.1 putative dehydrogenase [Singulisphaera acidiphila DSM 18658]
MIETVVVGYGLAGRAFHCPLIRRQNSLNLHGVVARSPAVRAEAVAAWGVVGYAGFEEALADSRVQLIVLATPHDSHAELAVRALEAGKDCVVDKVMALSEAEADRMIAARDASGRMLSVFQNRRWDWDYATLKAVLARGLIGQPLIIESSVCRHTPPRTWRGDVTQAGTILHDWGAHLVDQALQLGLGPCRRLSAWITPAPWPGVNSGGHGRIALEFDNLLFQVEMSRICRLERPRWWVVGTEGGYAKFGIDPQEDALRAGDIDRAVEPANLTATIRRETATGVVDMPVETEKSHWDSYYANIADHLEGRAPLAVTAEQARDVVRILDAAVQSASEHSVIAGPWGGD